MIPEFGKQTEPVRSPMSDIVILDTSARLMKLENLTHGLFWVTAANLLVTFVNLYRSLGK